MVNALGLDQHKAMEVTATCFGPTHAAIIRKYTKGLYLVNT